MESDFAFGRIGRWGQQGFEPAPENLQGAVVLEVLVDEHVYTAIDDASDTVSAWTKRDESVVPTQTQAAIAGWLDVDGDGRLDVLRIGPRGDETYPLVERTIAGGRSSPDDVVAQSAWQRLCPAPPRGPLRTTRAVHCALVWGAKRDEVEGRIDDARTDGSCREAQRRIARDSPSPVSLVGVCPSNEVAVASTPTVFDFTPCQ